MYEKQIVARDTLGLDSYRDNFSNKNFLNI